MGYKMENVSITLPVQAWNNILAVMGERPFKEVAELVMEIKKQAANQLASSTVAANVDSPEAQA